MRIVYDGITHVIIKIMIISYTSIHKQDNIPHIEA